MYTLLTVHNIRTHWKLQILHCIISDGPLAVYLYAIRRTVSCGSVFVLVLNYWSKLLPSSKRCCLELSWLLCGGVIAYSWQFEFKYIRIQRERSYFKHLKTQSKISACHLFCCSHVCITFVLNSHPVHPLLYPTPLNIYFSCYQNSEVKKYNIQFNVTINSTLYTIFQINYREFFCDTV